MFAARYVDADHGHIGRATERAHDRLRERDWVSRIGDSDVIGEAGPAQPVGLGLGGDDPDGTGASPPGG